MKHKKIAWIVVLILLAVHINLNAAPKYISSTALAKVIDTPVGKVTSGDLQVPLITWGADIRSIYANGNSRTTQQGSIFDSQGLKLKLHREDDFKKQIENYLSGKSPYLRGTLGMINMAAEVLAKDSRTQPIVIYQLSESAGGDAIVVKSGIKTANDLRGKTIALQAYGPHVDYLAKILQDTGLSMSDVKLKWLPDLTGTDDSPMAALYDKNVDAAMVIIPDALALTSGGNVGTGSEDSIKGARILLSTKTANRIIADVYAVRSDYFKSNEKEVRQFVHGLMLARDEVANLVANKAAESGNYNKLMRASAEILLDSTEAVSDAEALYGDANHIDHGGNIKFFQDKNNPRNFQRRNKEIQSALIQLGLLSKSIKIDQAQWDYASLGKGLTNVGKSEAPRFNQDEVATVIAKKQQQGTLDEGELFSFEVFFKPNQNSFPTDLYQDAFKKVISLASTYGGAVITIEGHSDPLGYLKQKKKGDSELVLKRVKQSAKNLSLTRANAVRDAVIQYASSQNIALDESQFATIGHGILKPKNGMCGSDPCAPKTEKQWRDNMRVEFRIIQVEAEADVFQPL
ncbi:MAG: ABC transporter substrate-binding protein [Gammaproteobacteria bacterium]|nr:ABC transporter substrate-binding protein [Gammaproteobacteria bacterium]